MIFKKIFVDTNPFIYYIEDIEPYSTKLQNFFSECIDEKVELYTSTITDAEFLVKPYKNNDTTVAEYYREFLTSMNFLKCFVNESVAEISARLRAKYQSIKLVDAIQIATALECNCEGFLTNDKQLKQISEINVILLDE